MLTFPVSSSTICTCPGDLPGKASNFCPRHARPMGLSVVSKTESFCGGLENAKMCILFNKATTIRDFDKRTPRTDVRNSSVMTAFCFASSQITNCKESHESASPKYASRPKLKAAHLVLRKFGISSSTNNSQVV